MAIFTHKRPGTPGDPGYAYTPFERQPGEEYTGRVLATRHTTVRVSSDHAWLDSGDRNYADVWDRGRVVTIFLSGGYDTNEYRTAEPDATDDVVARAAEYTTLVGWIRSLAGAVHARDRAVREASKIVRGARVLVVKGRKVKKGTEWYVYRTGNGQYGPYCHLSKERAGMGEAVQFVSTDNLQVIAGPAPDVVWPDCPYGPVSADVLAVALKLAGALTHAPGAYATDEPTANKLWHILHDAWEDHGGSPPALRRAALRQDD
jgi:hypothetical protein